MIGDLGAICNDIFRLIGAPRRLIGDLGAIFKAIFRLIEAPRRLIGDLGASVRKASEMAFALLLKVRFARVLT